MSKTFLFLKETQHLTNEVTVLPVSSRLEELDCFQTVGTYTCLEYFYWTNRLKLMKAKMSCAFDSKQRTNLRVVLVFVVDKQPDTQTYSIDSQAWLEFNKRFGNEYKLFQTETAHWLRVRITDWVNVTVFRKGKAMLEIQTPFWPLTFWIGRLK